MSDDAKERLARRRQKAKISRKQLFKTLNEEVATNKRKGISAPLNASV